MSGTNETVDRPLVTFALIAYNQERFIREAIEGAFAQTYEPLEIILSDDCSTDRTFELMQEAAASYSGPHRVIARKTPRNIGTFAHVMDLVKEVRGKLVVLAAGDDISKPERVARLVAAWQSTGAWGLYSRFDRINEDGKVLGVAQLSETLLRPKSKFRYFYVEDGPVELIPGVSSAYDVRIFEHLAGFSENFILQEDIVLSFTLNLLRGKVHFLNESLVCYREHQGSITNGGSNFKQLSQEDIFASEVKNTVFSGSTATRGEVFLSLVDSIDNSQARRVNREVIIRENEICRFKATWLKSTFIDRVKFLLSCRQKSDLKWIIPRLFGVKSLIKIKLLMKA